MLPSEKYYLKIGKAGDLEKRWERIVYRALEILPGFLAWATLLGIVFLSWAQPIWAAFFIIAFDVYWLLKTVYLSFHLRISYRQMKKQLSVDWLGKVKSLGGKKWQKIHHLIVLPVYKEPLSVIQTTLRAITESDYPKDKMIVVLAVEERAGLSARNRARKARKEFGGYFFDFLITVHPEGVAGEMACKGSNSSYGARQVKKKIIDPLKIPYKNIVVSCFDIDTQVYPRYFSCLSYHYLTAKKPTRSSYQPIPVYNNNIWDAPSVSRVVATSGTFWQMIQQQRPERLSTFSSQAVSFQALVDVDFWSVNIVSEDSRIFWKNLLFYDGKYQTIPLNYPVSMDANLSSSFLKTCLNVYKQQRRWGWGAENIPFLLFGFLKNKKIPWRQKFHWTWIQLEGFWSWATNALLIFFLGWLPLALGGQEFNVTVLSYNLPRVTRILMTLAMVGLVGSAIYSTLLLPKRPEKYKSGVKGRLKYFSMIIQWILVPVTILFFGAIPGLESQTRLMIGKYMGFWVTPKSKK
ncbi:glycosyltransferase family 2 protein [Patescibacteria group bacterium]|nr:glycosyltransferase family 2 protein [Patescibacteria group bacterium]MBU2579548.1 glycosyltransferase family 2 protein [Patescibacteria group bacterium]